MGVPNSSVTESEFLEGLPDSFLIGLETAFKTDKCAAQAEYDLAASVGRHGSAAACKERSVLPTFSHLSYLQFAICYKTQHISLFSFSSCPFPGSVLMAAMAQNGLSSKSD